MCVLFLSDFSCGFFEVYFEQSMMYFKNSTPLSDNLKVALSDEPVNSNLNAAPFLCKKELECSPLHFYFSTKK